MANKKEVKPVKEMKIKTEPKKKIRSTVEKGKAFITSTFNNTIISVTDTRGNVLSWSSAGVVGFKGSKKSTPYAASKAAEDAATKSSKYGMREVAVYLKGPGPGRQMAVKGLRTGGLKITTLTDVTPMPHNGCRAKKKPRN